MTERGLGAIITEVCPSLLYGRMEFVEPF